MKQLKKILCMCLCVSTVILLVGCGSKEVKKDSNSTDVTELMDTLAEINEQSERVTDVVTVVWNEAGADKVMGTLADMLDVENTDDIKEKLRNATNITYLFKAYDYELLGDIGMGYFTNSDEDAEEVLSICKDYKLGLQTISNDLESVETMIADVKKADEKKYDAIKEYYVETIAFGELAVSPSGSLNSYTSECKDYVTNNDKLKKTAELDVK